MSIGDSESYSLKQQEIDVPPLYGVDGSRAEEIAMYFPLLQGKDFLAWIDAFSKVGNAAILEIGGGRYQQAAIDILNRFHVNKYVAVEPRGLYDPTNKEVSAYSAYQLAQIGLSQVPSELSGQQFSVIFANSVAEHLPDPMSLVRISFPHLEEGGVLFANGISVTQAWLDRALGLVSDGSLAVMREQRVTPELRQYGLVSASMALQKSGDPRIVDIIQHGK